MGLPSGISVRLPDALRTRLGALASKSSLKPSDLVRMAVESYVSHAETSGQIQIPVFQETPAPSTLPPIPPREAVIYQKPPLTVATTKPKHRKRSD